MNPSQLSQTLNTDLKPVITNYAPAILGILIIIWVISRQLRPSMVTAKMRIYYILMIIGGVEILQYVQKSGLRVSFALQFLIYSLILPPLFGWLRVLTYNYWVSDKQQVMRKGNLLTALLWIIYMGGHIALDHFTKAPGNLFLLFDIGFSLLVQRYLAYRTASRKYPNEIQNNVEAEKKK
ncbi:MAG: hypothetical protein LBI43_00730 [Streptococcaceae bacterium]|jgi:hypothetical protein|nr:hypothetical protein [Streptococcaceae bacterium]